jgi:asparagine synthase (glutamine-hydrolysing)
VITEKVYRREKHPFHTPLMTTAPTERFHQMVQDTLRGSVLSSIPFYDQKKVVAVLDQIPAMSDSDRIAWDPVLIYVLSACVLQEKFEMGLTTPGDDLLDEVSGRLTGLLTETITAAS